MFQVVVERELGGTRYAWELWIAGESHQQGPIARGRATTEAGALSQADVHARDWLLPSRKTIHYIEIVVDQEGS